MSVKSFKYKPSIVQPSVDLESLDKFLESEKMANSIGPWSKLDKTAKLRKLISFSEQYKETNHLSDTEYELLIAFFKDCLDKKRLQKVKDVIYNKDTGEINDIPGLIFNKTANHFTLKNIDKRVSTLKGLGPTKKKIGTAKNIKEQDSDDEH
jgi:hypothetical protein